MSETPKGIVAVFVGPDGHCVASVSDFDTSGYGGYTMREAQEHRIRDAIATAVANALASNDFTKHIDVYHKREVLRAMERTAGYHLHLVPVGYEEPTHD
jgi:hypothetical protein